MNKNELISQIAEQADLTKIKAADALDAFLNVVTETLISGDEVRLIGFGTFLASDRKATTARNPRTGEEIQVAASKQPKFKAGKSLKDAVNGRINKKAA